MAKLLTDELNYLQIANAIRSKNFGASKYLPSEMPNAILGLGAIQNGVVQQAKSSSAAIPANTFVQVDTTWSNTDASRYQTTLAAQGSSDTTSRPKIIKISDTKFFVGYAGMDSGNPAFRFQNCSVSGDTITPGSIVTLDNTTVYEGGSDAYWDLIDIGNGTALFVYGTALSSAEIRAVAIDYSGETPRVGAPALIDSATSTYHASSAAKLEDGKAIVKYEKNLKTYAQVLTISGLVVTASTATEIYSSTLGYGYKTITALTSSFAVVLGTISGSSGSVSRQAYAIRLNISGTTITPSAGETVSGLGTYDISGSGGVSTSFALSSSRFLVSAKWAEQGQVYMALVESNAGGTVKLSGFELCTGYKKNAFRESYMPLSDGVIAVTHSSSSSTTGYVSRVAYDENAGTISAISGTVWQDVADSTINYAAPAIMLGDNRIVRVSGVVNGEGRVGAVLMHLPATMAASTTRIDGVTAEPIAASATGDIWVLNQGS